MSIINDLHKEENKEMPELEGDAIAAIAAAVAVMDEEKEIVAAITASIECMLKKSTSDFIVRNIKRTSEVHSLWALRGRI